MDYLELNENKNKKSNMIYGVDFEKLIYINEDIHDLRSSNIRVEF